MGRQRTAVRVNQFAGGFNKEANPLNFPEGASFDEQNCDLLSDGSRKRRNGFTTDFGTPINTGVGLPSNSVLGKNQFVWANAGGLTDKEFLVVQLGDYIAIHELTGTPITNRRVYTTRVEGADPTKNFGFTSVDGLLLIASGTTTVIQISYNGTTFTRSSGRLLIRDFFGVDVPGLTEPQNYQVRRVGAGHGHLYNLRNQTFALPRVLGTSDIGTQVIDPITSFTSRAGGRWPSNSDNVNFYLVANPDNDNNRTVERFNPSSMINNPPANTRAPQGYFIIDALDRGTSRVRVFRDLVNRNSALSRSIPTTIPRDSTVGGPTVTAQYAGRVWYAGFGGEVIGGDAKSPRLSSYLLFSQVVQEPSQIYWCYQQADPTDGNDPDLVDTDGGFIKIDGAYGIKSLVAAESSLFVFAENGVWRVVGTDENTFSATSYTVNKLTDKGCIAGQSVVYVDGVLMYWSENAIYMATQDRTGIWKVENVTDTSIKSFYQAISPNEKANVSGYFDDVTGTIRWLYGSPLGRRTFVDELVLNRKYQVFTKNRINLGTNNFGPISVSGGKLADPSEQVVTVLGEAVTVEGELVTSQEDSAVLSASQNFYCIVTSITPTVRYAFGGYSSDESPYDWGTVDSPAYLTTGFVTGGEARLIKDVPYITTYFNYLEENPGSCIIQARWDWTRSIDSGRWTNPRQAYRTANVRSGDTTVVTRNRIRGMGKSVAFNLSSEPGQWFHIFGWEHNLEATTDE